MPDDRRLWGVWTLPQLALLVLAAGYVAALPVLRWHRRDLMSFRRPLWTGYGSRQTRLRGAVVCYVTFGWPELFMALGWRSSHTRGALVIEREQMREARSRHRIEDTTP